MEAVHLLTCSNSNSSTLVVKSSPPRTAQNMSELGTCSGWLLKRDEKHNWHKRYCVSVPHTFLYYFESLSADAPRGVIDLEGYEEIGVDEGTGVISLVSGGDMPLRTFYFKAEEESEMHRWASSLHRDKFTTMRDERDAYRHLQEEFQDEQIACATTMAKFDEEKTALLTKLHGAQTQVASQDLQLQDQLQQLHNLASSITHNTYMHTDMHAGRYTSGSDSSTDSSHSTDTSISNTEIHDKVRSFDEGIASIRESFRDLQKRCMDAEDKCEHLASEVARAAQAQTLQAQEIEKLTREHETTSELCERTQALLSAERSNRIRAEQESKDVTRQLQEALLNANQAQVNLNIMTNLKEAAEARVTEVQQQQKVLIREVRSARRSAAESKEFSDRLASAYESLELTLRKQLQQQQASSSKERERSSTEQFPERSSPELSSQERERSSTEHQFQDRSAEISSKERSLSAEETSFSALPEPYTTVLLDADKQRAGSSDTEHDLEKYIVNAHASADVDTCMGDSMHRSNTNGTLAGKLSLDVSAAEAGVLTEPQPLLSGGKRNGGFAVWERLIGGIAGDVPRSRGPILELSDEPNTDTNIDIHHTNTCTPADTNIDNVSTMSTEPPTSNEIHTNNSVDTVNSDEHSKNMNKNENNTHNMSNVSSTGGINLNIYGTHSTGGGGVDLGRWWRQKNNSEQAVEGVMPAAQATKCLSCGALVTSKNGKLTECACGVPILEMRGHSNSSSSSYHEPAQSTTSNGAPGLNRTGSNASNSSVGNTFEGALKGWVRSLSFALENAAGSKLARTNSSMMTPLSATSTLIPGNTVNNHTVDSSSSAQDTIMNSHKDSDAVSTDISATSTMLPDSTVNAVDTSNHSSIERSHKDSTADTVSHSSTSTAEPGNVRTNNTVDSAVGNTEETVDTNNHGPMENSHKNSGVDKTDISATSSSCDTSIPTTSILIATHNTSDKSAVNDNTVDESSDVEGTSEASVHGEETHTECSLVSVELEEVLDQEEKVAVSF